MGNDSSKLKGLVIEKQTAEANDFWALFNAESPTTSTTDEVSRQFLSVFIGETVVKGQLWVQQGPLERAIKNFMIYRHPYILKYVATWEQGGQRHLATERVRPLTTVLSSQSDIQVCLGLRTILCSLIFLTEKAMARHLNISTSSIYITENGSWRLAGFEYVWKNKEVTKPLLDLANTYRYQPAVDPDELLENNIDYIEQYAFATLCEEVLAKCTKTETATPHVQEFRDYCATHLRHKNAQMRPKLSAVLLHPYFNHEFVLIHSFLFELPLKSVEEKQDFFSGLIGRLRYFNEEVVGVQLAADLLSRMVLLDPTAQLCVTPYVLKTKTDHSAALFSNATYLRYLMPHIKKMFRLRDAQIRLILLEYFMEFVRLLTKEELQDFILPHLMAGMNDTNDVLVAKTLRCLADLVPILGSATVIGGQRSRLFSDGRPQAAVPETTTHWVEPRSITPVMGDNTEYMVSSSPLPDIVDLSGSFNSLPQLENGDQLEMPPRLSPDGGEDDKSVALHDGLVADEAEILAENVVESLIENATATVFNSMEASLPLANNVKSAIDNETDADEDGVWSDWETDELQRLNDPQSSDQMSNNLDLHDVTLMPEPNGNSVTHSNSMSNNENALPSQISLTDSMRSTASTTQSLKSIVPKISDDLDSFDIKVQKLQTSSTARSDEFDFFKDMEPVINTKRNSILLTTNTTTSITTTTSTTSTDTASATSDAFIDEEIYIDKNRFAAVPLDTRLSDDDDHLTAADGWGVDDAEEWNNTT